MRGFDAAGNVLGACLISKDAYWRCADLLTQDDFATEPYRLLWRAISELASEGVAIDYSTVAARAPSVGQLAIEVANATPSAANVRSYAQIVQGDAMARRVRAAGLGISKLAGADAMGAAQSLLAACAPRMSSAIRPVSEYLADSTAMMAARCEQTDELTGVPTSLPWLDRLLSGWQAGDMILMGARPSVGKTALAVQAAMHAAQQGKRVLFLSLEMTGIQLTDRMLAHLSGVDSQLLRQPKRMDESHWPKIVDAGAVIAALPLLIDETSSLYLDGVCARIRQAHAAAPLGLVVIDYLTQIIPPRAEKLVDAIQIITRTLKGLAKELKLPILLLSQLNRAADKVPTLTSLRESGAIEQDADVVLLLSRPDETQRHLLLADVAKQRNGPTGSTYLHFDGETGRFRETDETPPLPPARAAGFGKYPRAA